jgi:hypothetical protein
MAFLSGMVMDYNPSTVNITFTGAVTASINADSLGNFSYIGPASGLGTVFAVATDGNNLTSNTSQAQLTKPAPFITMSLTYGTQNTVTVAGQVIDIDAGGRTVNFSGVVSGLVVTNSDGTFSFTARATGLGTIQAVTFDLWAQSSNIAQVTVSSNAPVISMLSGVEGVDGWWTFSGQVTDESPAGLQIIFGGLAEVSGDTATVQTGGTFSLLVQLPVDVVGTLFVQTTDWWGLTSNIATFTII